MIPVRPSLALGMLLLGAGLAGAAAAGQARPARPPNIVFILADDLGWRDTAVYGSRFYDTPNLERLARRGKVFTNAYSANPLCSPTRASILTGQYPGRLRFTTPSGHLREEVLDPAMPARGPADHKAVQATTRTRLPLEYYTLAEALRDAGYSTAHFGKWHLGWAPYGPEAQGFQVHSPGGSYPGPPSYLAPYKIPTLADGPPGEHIDDRMTDAAVRYLREHRDRPFFLSYWMFSVHAPFQAKPELVRQYRDKAGPDDPQRCPTMGAMVRTMDDCVGRILDALDELKLAENTLLVFTSDNGGNMYSRVDGTVPTSNAPLRGGKATIYEGGTRVPLIVSWPAKVRRGSRSKALVSSIDWYPTLLEAAGTRGKPEHRADGESLLPALTGDGAPRREALFCHSPHYVPATGNLPSTWVRKGDWKLIRFFADGPGQEDRFELYNLKEDEGETRNRAGAEPERVRELNGLIERHLRETGALLPFKNPAYGQTYSGWVGNTNAELDRDNGALVVRSTGADPFLITRSVPAAMGPFTVELRMQSRSRGMGQVFWGTPQAPGFRGDRSAGFEPLHDGAWHEYRVELPVSGALAALRLDPCTAPGEVRIEWIRLRDAAGGVVREWRFDGE